MQKSRIGGKFSVQISGVERGEMVMAKIDSCIIFRGWGQKIDDVVKLLHRLK